jgi:hypothetical protein
MPLLARQNNFVNGTTADADQVDADFNNLVNALNGTTTNTGVLIRSNDTNFATLRCDTLSTNNAFEAAVSGILKVSVNNSGQIISAVAGGTAPISVTSTTVCPNLNADLIDGIDGSNLAKLDTHKAAWSFGWFYPTPPAAVEGTQSVHDFSVPAGNSITAAELRIIRTGGSHTGATVLTFTIFRRDSTGGILADLGTISLNDTNASSGVTYTNNITDVPLNSGDRLSVILTTRTGSPTESQITVIVCGTQKFTT